ncbi:hypothetical protein Ahy_B09g098122 [Arachis hypogaea]|uniref:Reverse transcriptase Ty1/copia-type domain-containing protein n=1 Tax=Arachis hypogaea TaxID=3818 RepID=A0A444XQR7_ARAHY|nr:hypothetical protein Ahy_B09g098122 [Arachis hypogaea]
MTTESISSHTPSSSSALDSSPPSPSHPTSPSSPSEQFHLRHSDRPHRPPGYLSDYLCNSSLTSTNHSLLKYRYPLSSFKSFSSLSSSHNKYLLSLYSDVEAKSFKANQHSNWRSAMKDEMDALELNKTWRLVDCTGDIKPVGCKWVYHIKRKLDRSVDRTL